MVNPTSIKIRRLCWLVRAVALVLLASVLLLYLGSWLFPEWALWDNHWARMARIGGLPAKASASLQGADYFLVGAACLPYLACLALAFFHLDRMLRAFERGDFFERATVRHLRAFAGLLLLAKALSFAANHIRLWIYMPVAAPGTKFVFSMTSDELALLLMCALFFLIAHLMDEGNRLAEENRGFL